MTALEKLFGLAARLEACGLPGAALRLRGCALDLGGESVPLFEALVDAIAEHRALAGELLAWLDDGTPNDDATRLAIAEMQERARSVIDDPPGCGWCCSRDHQTEACMGRRRS